jgi:hypothetical protein
MRNLALMWVLAGCLLGCGGGGKSAKDKAVSAADTTDTAAIALDTVASTPDASLDTGSDTDSIDDTKAPYEATWLQVTKTDNGYVIYNYPSWHDAMSIKPVIIRVRGDSLIILSYREYIFLRFSNIELLNENSYSMLNEREVGGEVCTTYIRFNYIDKDKRIAKWTISQNEGYIMIEEIYVDSSYNTFPIVDYKWGSGQK